jgi:Short C-terminal domain
MRSDIQAAYNLLDGRGQASITGLRAAGTIKKAYDKLEDFLPEETVLALAVGFDPPPGFAQQRGMRAGQALGAIMDAAKSGRLLALTETNLYEVQATGMLNGHKPQGIQIRLTDIGDVRSRSTRKLTSTERILMVDHARGPQRHTEIYSINSDSELEVFAPRLQAQVEAVRARIDEIKRRSHGIQESSVADEIAKLAQLKEAGVLTDEEFTTQKSRLLGSSR